MRYSSSMRYNRRENRLLHAILFIVALIFLAATGITGCTTMHSIDEHVNFDPAGKITFYRDNWVQRNPPEVHVEALGSSPDEPKVLFIPFRVTQSIDNPSILGYGTARTFWQTWLTMQIFPTLEFSADDTPYRRDRAIQLARARKADIVIGGFVTYVYAGGTAGDSQLALQLEAHDVCTGQLIWSMAQSGLMSASRTNDYFIVATKTRMPSDPLHAITQVLAVDMGKEIQKWTGGTTAKTRLQEFDEKAHQTIFSPKDSVPRPGASGANAANDSSSYVQEP
ncbi:hypothetical protein LJC46_10115, partial [Desulfovibrio sp. OttesenSCG-928-G15]|nr:hypothetical protein [Desulfovibrio sp. OttesenSCG-928-G15]